MAKRFKKKAKKPINPRPKIEYPPVPTRKWVPPEERPKKKKPPPKYVKPAEISVKLELSSLQKIWHNFVIHGDRAIITGSWSQTYKRYSVKSNGYQAPCNCIVAIAFSKLFEITQWSYHTLDKILDTGDYLYHRTIFMMQDNEKKELKLNEVYHTYYIDKIKVTMDLKGTKYFGRLLPDLDETPHLADILMEFFDNQQSGVLVFGDRYFAIFMVRKGYYFFDPVDHERDGSNWQGVPGWGYCLLAKVPTSAGIVPLVQENLKCVENPNFTLTPCNILRKFEINTKYPSCMEDANLELKFPPTRDRMIGSTAKLAASGENADFAESGMELQSKAFEEDDDEDEEEENKPEDEAEVSDMPEAKSRSAAARIASEPQEIEAATTQTRKRREVRAPIEKVKAASLTYFLDIVPSKVGILRASTHQCDPKFTKYPGKQSIPNAIAAIGMLSVYKSKYWTSNILDDILKTGESILHDTLKPLRGTDEKEVKVNNLCKTFAIYEQTLVPRVEEITIVGQLNSQTDEKIDLLPALKEFFTENDACIICGPVTLAVWSEKDLYYMFDPNERDNNGLVIIKQVQIGSFLKVYDVLPGLACLTWYSDLKDLVEVYMKNVPKEERRNMFVISKAEVDQYQELPDPWHNFQTLTTTKWILQGTFSQNSKRYEKETRNTQCTAMAAMAIAMTELKPVTEWNSDTLDDILDHGNKYYEYSINYLKEKDKFVSRLLMVIELLPKYILEDKELCFEIEECLVNGNLSFADEDEIPNLKKGFAKFFDDNDAGVLTCRNISVAVWKRAEAYFYFDSHSKNDSGLNCFHGTSMVLRVTTIEELTKVILGNLAADTNSQYNISRVAIKIVDAGAGIPKPPLNNFTAVTETKAILRASYSQDDAKFKINKGKQTIPNTMVALGMTNVYPTAVWNRDIMNEVLTIGNQLYQESMEVLRQTEEEMNAEAFEPQPTQPEVVAPPPPPEPEPEPAKGKKGRAKKEEPVAPPPPPPEPETHTILEEEDEDNEDITSSRVTKQFRIGINEFQIELGEVQEGSHQELEHLLSEIYDPKSLEEVADVNEPSEAATEMSPPPPPPLAEIEDDGDKKQRLLESDALTVVMWKEDGMYYVFDPKPRDPSGQVYGKDEWSQLPPPPSEPSTTSVKTAEDLGSRTDEVSMAKSSEGDAIIAAGETDDGSPKLALKKPEALTPAEIDAQILEEEGREAEIGIKYAGDYEDLEEEEEEEYIPMMEPPPPKHSPSYWLEQEKNGKACAIRFLTARDMIKHVVENIPPLKGEEPFKLTTIEIINETKVHDVYDPELGPPPDNVTGDWKNFREVDHGKWILRGTTNDMDETFPEDNRGKQSVAMAFVALGYNMLYSLQTFTHRTIDDILMYGDRLLTFTKNQRIKEVTSMGEGYSAEMAKEIVNAQDFGIPLIARQFCIGSDRVVLEIVLDVIGGEINAQKLETELDVERGLRDFFQKYKTGMLTARGQSIAVWKKGHFYYMFDPHSRGPSGLACPNGVACITRFLEPSDMAKVFLNNLEKEGESWFAIHAINVSIESCPREEVRKEKPKLRLSAAITSFDPVADGKTIVRGSISQESPAFGRKQNAQFGPMAFVALAMTLVHRCMFWTKPIIDEIITIGDRLYASTLDDLGYEFNPWEQELTLDLTPTRFKIGAVKVDCELRPYDQTGIVNIKNSSQTSNLRQGLEKFFQENTYGVIQTEALTLAVWEENEPKRTLYLFDPCSRGPTGMPQANGAACVISFATEKQLADHFMALVPEHAGDVFTIRPVEIVVGKTKGRRKKKRSPCASMDFAAPRMNVARNNRYKQKYLEALYKHLREVRRMQTLGQKRFYPIPGTEMAILRGTKRLSSNCYSTHSRGKQDIPVCLAAYVMERLLPFEKWTAKIIDLVLDVGDQLYKDSYVTFNPTNDKLGLTCVLREIIIKDVLVEIAIGRPVLISEFNYCTLENALELCFREKNYCMLYVNNTYVALFTKENLFYLFDPHGSGIDGRRDETKGTACVLKFNDLKKLCTTVVDNLKSDAEEKYVFYLILVAIKGIREAPRHPQERYVDF